MEVIAKTQGAFLISATELEIKEIVNAVTGSRPKDVEIGQKIPAIDYASTITKIKNLKENGYFRDLLLKHKYLTESIQDFSKSVESASSIDI